MPKPLAERLRETGKQFYAIAFSMRCGSTLLCEDLKSRGVGVPSECFQTRFYLPAVAAGSHTAVADYILRLVDQTPGPVFGFKIEWEQAFILRTYMAREGIAVGGPDFLSIFPDLKWVHIWRENKALQAISLWRAAQTHVWHVTSEDQSFAERDPGYDYKGIEPFFTKVLTEDWLWRQMFRQLGIAPFDICYERYITDRAGTLNGIQKYLGIEKTATDVVSTSLKVMRTGWSAEMEKRFLTDLYRPGNPVWYHEVFPTPLPNQGHRAAA